MAKINLRRRMVRGWNIYRSLGLAGFAARLVAKLRVALGGGSAGQRAYLQRKARVDAAFDDGAGADTGGIQHLYDLTVVGPHAGFGISHIASDPDEFAAAMAALDQDPAAATFVDLGSGKGRALLLAAAFPFPRLIGVEFAAELHAVATANLAARADRARFLLLHADATTIELPATPLVLYLFNPFDAPVLATVARRALAAWHAAPRPITLVYVNPLHAAVLTAAGWREQARGGAFALFVPA